MKFISFSTLRSMCIDFVIILVPISVLFYAMPFLLRILLPFIFGFFLYLAARPLNKRMRKRLPPSFSAFFSLFFISLCVFILLRAGIQKITDEISAFMENPPTLYTEALISATQKLRLIMNPEPLGELSLQDSVLSKICDALLSQLTVIFSSVSTFLLNAAKNLPSLLIASFASVFTAFFLLKEDTSFFEFFRRFFGEKTFSFLSDIKTSFFSVTASYLKAQFIVGTIIFSVLFAGFSILKIRYSFILAVLTALVDVIPVFGTGTVLIPIAVFSFLTSDKALGWGLLVLYGITLLVRQLCEPKIIGKSLGIHPLATIFAIYTGLKLFGVWGLIFGPICAILIKNLVFSKS